MTELNHWDNLPTDVQQNIMDMAWKTEIDECVKRCEDEYGIYITNDGVYKKTMFMMFQESAGIGITRTSNKTFK